MVNRPKRLSWGQLGRILYILQLTGNRAWSKGWTDVLRARWRKWEKIYKSYPESDHDASLD